jgi:galactokinase
MYVFNSHYPNPIERSLPVSRVRTTDQPVEYSRTELMSRSSDLFKTTFGSTPTCVAVAPGRVNLIGEHTDYNGGYVLPAAIDRSIAVAVSPRADSMLLIHSQNMHALVQISLEALHPQKQNSWVNYTAGVAYFLKRSGVELEGASICILGNIPQAAGLSSSAALELASAYALATLFGGRLTSLELVKLCKQAENDFVGVSCGIMDQFVAALGKSNHAMLLDCISLNYEYVSLPPNVRLLVCDTGVKRELPGTAYNKRRQECFYAVKQLSTAHPGITSLRDVSLEQIQSAEHSLDSVLWRRARHVVSENQRVLDSARALKENNLSEFGKLMYQSHLSLKLDFEVSCPELDAIVDICAEADGVHGARMTGAGFGGSAVCLVEEHNVEEVKARLETEYPSKTGRTPSIHVCSIEDGATVHTTLA